MFERSYKKKQSLQMRDSLLIFLGEKKFFPTLLNPIRSKEYRKP